MLKHYDASEEKNIILLLWIYCWTMLIDKQIKPLRVWNVCCQNYLYLKKHSYYVIQSDQMHILYNISSKFTHRNCALSTDRANCSLTRGSAKTTVNKQPIITKMAKYWSMNQFGQYISLLASIHLIPVLRLQWSLTHAHTHTHTHGGHTEVSPDWFW